MILAEKFKQYIYRKKLISADDKILLAVSGGIDSMTMLHLMVECGYTAIAVAHCNFRLRGVDSDRDEELVRRTCSELGVECYVVHFDTISEAEGSHESIQMVARRLRYTWFNELCDKHLYTKIAIAHHADDSVETFFINLIRGTGLRGLVGIPQAVGSIIRPLLFARRDDIVGYAAENDVEYRNDATNSSLKYLRNRIRWDIIPRLLGTSAAFPSTMAENLDRLELVQQFVDERIAEIKSKAVSSDNYDYIVDLECLKAYKPLQFVLYELLRDFGFGGDVVEDLTRGVEQRLTGRRYMASGYVATIDRNRLIISQRTAEMFEEETIADSSAYLNIEYLPREVLTTIHAPADTAFLDADTLEFPLTLRRWREGDWFIPLGMAGQKKVSDFLIDTKVSLPDKERGLVLTSAGQIIWLVGKRIDDRFKITDRTKNVVIFSIKS